MLRAASRFAILLLSVLSANLCTGVSVQAAAGDVPGSADYPEAGRFDGAVITSYDDSEFDNYWLATGEVISNEHGSGQTLEGRIVRITYEVGDSLSVLQVARNYQNRLTGKGYDTLYDCADERCGGYNFRYYGTEVLPEPNMVVDLSDFHYSAMQKGGTYVTVLVSTNNDIVYAQVIAVDTGEMADSMVDAKQMASSISETGKIALYDIHFDTDSAAIKPESRPALDQISQLMKDRPDLKILVVGHTDNQGSLDYNLGLSTQRAQAIVEDLVETYAIGRGRMTPAGAAFLAPVASNRTEEGRAQNRRVELVER